MKLKLTSFIFLIFIFSAKISAQNGTDIIFLIDNSFSMSNSQLENAITSTKLIMDKVIDCNPNNRVAVAQYAYDLTRNNHSPVHINTDFTRDKSFLNSITKRRGFAGLGGSDDLEYAVKTISDALQGYSNDFIKSDIKTLNKKPGNNLLLFIFTDANRGSWDTKSFMVKTKRVLGILSVDKDAQDPLESYNHFKKPIANGGLGGEIVMMNGVIYGAIGDVSPAEQKSYAVAISSVGGEYNATTPAPNPYDPQGNQVLPRKYHSIPENRWGKPESLSHEDVLKLTEYVCSYSNNIVASSDSYSATYTQSVNGIDNMGNILNNDTYNSASATINNVNITVTSAATPNNPGDPVPSIDTSTGNVTLPAGTPSGNYTITYKICDKANIICDTTTVTITVSPLTLQAVDGSQAIAAGETGTVSVLTNDIYNAGTAGSATLSNVNITPISTTNSGVSLDPTTGLISVAAGTPAGSYDVVYKICDKVNTTVCSTATETITVGNSIDANDDSYTVTADKGIEGIGNLGNILDNDTYNNASATINNVNITVTSPATPNNPGDPVPSIDTSTGNVTLPAGTPSGNYTIKYKICDSSGSPCDTATVTVTVSPLTLQAVDGSQAIAAGETGTVSVLTNDIYNAGTAGSATLSNVNITPISTTYSGVTLDPTTGLISVAAGTPAGSYDVVYKICDKVNTTVCSTATETVTVGSNIDANDDSYTVTADEGIEGIGNLGNILDNDTNNSVTANTNNVVITITSPATPLYSGASVPSIDGSTGNVTLPAGTPSGVYEITYKICDSSGSPCDSATVKVTVQQPITCTQNPTGGTPEGYTPVGITTQPKRMGWPKDIPNGWLTLESNTKGFVISRVMNNNAITEPKEGMVIYNIQAKCVQLFNGKTWKCIKKSCNN